MIVARFEAMEGMYEEMQEASAQPEIIADVPRSTPIYSFIAVTSSYKYTLIISALRSRVKGYAAKKSGKRPDFVYIYEANSGKISSEGGPFCRHSCS